jgi:hypothetical protein
MPGLCSLITLLLLTHLATLAVWALWSLVAAIATRRRKLRYIIIGLPASLGIVVLAYSGLWFYTNRPSVVFEKEFGFTPPADTQPLRASISAFADTGEAYLHFRTSAATFARLSAGYVPDTFNFSTNVQPPSWFTPRRHTQRLVREGAIPRPGAFGSEFRRLYYDASTGEAWYLFVGVD